MKSQSTRRQPDASRLGADKDTRVTLVVPCWQAEKYIPDFWARLKNQTYSNFNVIFAIDGATDRTLELCRAIEAEDARVKVLDLPHGGVSAARNAGIEAATTPWVMFFDVDDRPRPRMMEEVSTRAFDCDLVICSTKAVYEEFGIPQIVEEGTYTIKEVVDGIKEGLMYTVHAKCFRKSILEKAGLKFDVKLRMAEDTLFMWQYLQLCETVKQSSLIIGEIDIHELTRKYKMPGAEAAYGLAKMRREIDRMHELWQIDSPHFHLVYDRLFTQVVLRYIAGVDDYKQFVREIRNFTSQHGIVQSYRFRKFFRWAESNIIMRLPQLGYFLRKTF